MNDEFHISEILRDGFNTVTSSRRKYLLLLWIPLVCSILTVLLLDIYVDSSYVGTILGSYAIFTGFFFTLIVYVSDKATNKKKELALSIEEVDQRFLKRYLQFSERLIVQISYAIVISILAIILLFLSQFNFILAIKGYDIGRIYFFTINILTIALCINFLIFLLLIISNMYALFLEETKG